MPLSDAALVARMGTGLGLSYALGFERQLRGSVAGDRTFALVGTAAAAITAVAATSSPQAVAGVATGIGFIGAGVVFRGRTGSPHGVTTAATILAAAAIGIVVGYGHLLVGTIVAGATLLVLEVPSVPILRFLDARTFAGLFRDDPEARSAREDLGGPRRRPPGGSGATRGAAGGRDAPAAHPVGGSGREGDPTGPLRTYPRHADGRFAGSPGWRGGPPAPPLTGEPPAAPAVPPANGSRGTPPPVG